MRNAKIIYSGSSIKDDLLCKIFDGNFLVGDVYLFCAKECSFGDRCEPSEYIYNFNRGEEGILYFEIGAGTINEKNRKRVRSEVGRFVHAKRDDKILCPMKLRMFKIIGDFRKIDEFTKQYLKSLNDSFDKKELCMTECYITNIPITQSDL